MTRLVVVVVLVFAGCWLPIQIVLLLKAYDIYDPSVDTVKLIIQITAHILAYMNSCVNPILYAFLSENFRKAFRKVIICCPGSGSGPRFGGPITDYRGAQSDLDRAAIELSVNNTYHTKITSRVINENV